MLIINHCKYYNWVLNCMVFISLAYNYSLYQYISTGVKQSVMQLPLVLHSPYNTVSTVLYMKVHLAILALMLYGLK